MYAVVIYLAFAHRPPEVTYVTKPAEVRAYLKECEGTAGVVETFAGYELTCEKK